MQITKRWLCVGAIAVAAGAMPAPAGAQNTADLDAGRRLFQGKPMPDLELPAHIEQHADAMEQSAPVATEADRKVFLPVLR